MKKLLCFGFFAAMMLGSLAGCGQKAENAASTAGSVVSGVASNMGEAAEDVGEGVTAAVSAAMSEADRMMENGQISDGDGIIGNEGEETVPTLAEGETTDTNNPQ